MNMIDTDLSFHFTVKITVWETFYLLLGQHTVYKFAHVFVVTPAVHKVQYANLQIVGCIPNQSLNFTRLIPNAYTT